MMINLLYVYNCRFIEALGSGLYALALSLASLGMGTAPHVIMRDGPDGLLIIPVEIFGGGGGGGGGGGSSPEGNPAAGCCGIIIVIIVFGSCARGCGCV